MSESSLSAPRRLAPEDRCDAFSCGAPALDRWLVRQALANEARGASRTFVVCSGESVVAYYSLAVGGLDRVDAPGHVRRNMPDPIPVMLLGRLAVDRSFQGKGLGADLLKDALARTLQAAQIAGIRAMVVHAISEQARSFYEAHGFRRCTADSLNLAITLDEAARAL